MIFISTEKYTWIINVEQLMIKMFWYYEQNNSYKQLCWCELTSTDF